MITTIPFHGITTTPSDYASQDGDLALALNLVSEDGQLSPIPEPDFRMSFSAPEGMRVLAIHRISADIANCILCAIDDQGIADLRWCPLERTDQRSVVFNTCTQIGTFDQLRDLKIHGNFLVFATADGIRYALWRNGAYDTLPQEHPFVNITFALNSSQNTIIRGRRGQYDIVAKLGDRYVQRASGAIELYNDDPTDPDYNSMEREARRKAACTAVHDAIRAAFNKEVHEGIASGCFYHPFFVRYAVKLYDGTYAWHSAPVLMLPSYGMPVIYCTDVTFRPKDASNSNSGGYTEIAINTSLFRPCTLQFKIHDNAADFSQWRNLISSIDIFVSAPIYTYVEDQNYDDDSQSFYWQTVKAGFLIGQYGINGADYVKRRQSTDITTAYPFKPKPNWVDGITDCAAFYLLESIDFDDIKAAGAFVNVPLRDKDLTNIVTRPTLPDEYLSHSYFAADFLKVYNSRLHFSPALATPPEPFPLGITAPYDSSAQPRSANVKIYMLKNGIVCLAQAQMVNECFDADPFFFYYPDPNAFKMVVTIGNQEHVYRLKHHSFLNGSYYFADPHASYDYYLGDTNTSTPDPQFPYDDYDITHPQTTYSLSNKVFTSEVDNPFVFPATHIVTIGSSKVVALESAAKALSQGQFGQYPMYAFSDEGIWALEVASNGAYSARQPITRDVCTSPRSITQLDSAVVFPADRGLMLLSGSTVQSITDAIFPPQQFEPSALQGLGTISPLPLPESFNLRQFLADCQISYDYAHQRLLVFNADDTYALVFSLKSSQWSMASNPSYTYAVPSYPNAFVMQQDDLATRMYNLSSPYGTPRPSMLVTRPIKLGDADTLKTIHTIIVRGDFARSHVSTILYGSRDMRHWHLVRSSVDHIMRGFRGSPYKYFRLAAIASLQPGESILGAAIDFSPRLTNQLR